MRRGIGHSAATTARTETATFATKSEDARLSALGAAQPQKAVGKDSALQEFSQLSLYEARDRPRFFGPVQQERFEFLLD